MAIQNVANTAYLFAWDVTTGLPKTGDAANITANFQGDGSSYTPAGAVAEVSATLNKGLYKVALTAGEMNYKAVIPGGNSATANVAVVGIGVIYTEQAVLATLLAKTDYNDSQTEAVLTRNGDGNPLTRTKGTGGNQKTMTTVYDVTHTKKPSTDTIS